MAFHPPKEQSMAHSGSLSWTEWCSRQSHNVRGRWTRSRRHKRSCSIIAARFEIIVWVNPSVDRPRPRSLFLPPCRFRSHFGRPRPITCYTNLALSLGVAKSQLSSFSALLVCRRRVSQTRNDDVSTAERMQHCFLEVIFPLAAN